MSPETINYLSTAEVSLNRAQRGFEAQIYDGAARDAYLAMLNAARAIIFEKTGVAPKTHSGTRSQFHKLVREGLPFDTELIAFLNRGFETKQNVDYGPPVLVSRSDAETFVSRAAAFVMAAADALRLTN